MDCSITCVKISLHIATLQTVRCVCMDYLVKSFCYHVSEECCQVSCHFKREISRVLQCFLYDAILTQLVISPTTILWPQGIEGFRMSRCTKWEAYVGKSSKMSLNSSISYFYFYFSTFCYFSFKELHFGEKPIKNQTCHSKVMTY